MHQLRKKLGALPPFETRNWLEKRYVLSTFNRPFSAYLGGVHSGGYWVERLSDEWKSTFLCQYAIPCNSATSGLLAACMAVGVGAGDLVWAPLYTMSATAACAKVLGAEVRFIDVEPKFFSMNMLNFPGGKKPKAIIVTNLFGHPAFLKEILSWCNTHRVWMIEDNSQSPFSKIRETYAGTIGHIGVWSLNIHKHLQVGEGGVITTNDAGHALGIRDAINHGELRPGSTGLNLRMTEPTAALACAQLSKGPWIVEGRRELALELTDMVKDFPQIHPPQELSNCRHVYYIWAAKVWSWQRQDFVGRLNNLGIPMREGYSPPLHRVFNQPMTLAPVAENLEDKELVTFETCRYSPTTRQLKIMRQIFQMVADSM